MQTTIKWLGEVARVELSRPVLRKLTNKMT